MTLSVTSLGGAQFSGVSVMTLSVTGATGGRIVLSPAWETNAGGTLTISSVAGLSATWAQRSRNAVGVYDQVTEVWYADLTTSFSVTITVTLSGNVDDGNLLAGLVVTDGANPIAWDTNGSLPATPAIGVGTASVSTDTAVPFVVLAGGKPDNVFWSSPTPAGISNVGTENNAGGSQHEYSTLDAGTTAKLSSTTTGYTAGAGDNFGSVCIDALSDGSTPADTGNMVSVLGV